MQYSHTDPTTPMKANEEKLLGRLNITEPAHVTQMMGERKKKNLSRTTR